MDRPTFSRCSLIVLSTYFCLPLLIIGDDLCRVCDALYAPFAQQSVMPLSTSRMFLCINKTFFIIEDYNDKGLQC